MLSFRLTPTRNEIHGNDLEGQSVLKNFGTTTNAVVGSVRRWRWSPVTCFEEFCAKICIEHFVNRPIDGVPGKIYIHPLQYILMN